MYCDDCDITIPYETDTCPLCFKKISDVKVLDNPIYPRRDSSFRFPAKYSFSLFYSVIAISVFAIVLLINLLTNRTILWAVIVGIGLLYTFILIRHTIMTPYGSASKIFVQGLILSVAILIIQNVTHTGIWAYNYAIPMMLVGNTIVLWLLALVRKVRRANYVLSLIGISALNMIPLIWFFMYNTVLWTMIVSVSTAVVTALLVILIFGKLLISEVKRLFHT